MKTKIGVLILISLSGLIIGCTSAPDAVSGASGYEASAGHGWIITVTGESDGTASTYTGIPLWMLLAYADDPRYQPHKQQDHSIRSYNEEAAKEGYLVRIAAEDGFSVVLDSRELHRNEDIIRAVRNVTLIELFFDR